MKIICFCGNDHVRLARIIERVLSEQPYSLFVSSVTQVLKPYEKRDPKHESEIVLSEIEKEKRGNKMRPLVTQLSLEGWKELVAIMKLKKDFTLYGIFINTAKQDLEKNFLSLSNSFLGEKLEWFIAESENQLTLFEQEKDTFIYEFGADLSDEVTADMVKKTISQRVL